MKKIIALIAAAAVLTSLCACGNKQNDSKKNDSKKSEGETNIATGVEATPQIDVSKLTNTDINAIEGEALAVAENEGEDAAPASGDIEQFGVSIGDAKIVDSVDGKAVIIEITFTNNTTHPKSYDGIMNETVSQNGSELFGTTILEEIDGYNPLSSTNQVDGGKSIKVQKVYALNDEESDVTINVFRYSEPEKGMVSKTFKLK